MKYPVIYIKGKGDHTARFTGLTGGQIHVAGDIAAAMRTLTALRAEHACVLYEQRNPGTDCSNIRFLRSRFPETGIILITPGHLRDEERRSYLRAGVNSAMAGDVSDEDFKRTLQFMTDYTFTHRPVVHRNEEVQVFRMPLWKRAFDIAASLGAIIALSPLLLAVALSKKGLKGAGLFQAIFYIPGLISIAAGALVWRMVFNSQFGLLNTTFHSDINWLGKNPYAWITIFVLVLWAGIGGNLVIYRSALSGVDESLYEAAKVDGAGPVRIFFSITLPEIKLPLFYTTIMTTTGAFNVWGQPVMLTNGGPNYQTQVLLMDIRNLAFPAGPAAAGMASAMALLLGIILMAIAAIQLIFMNKED